MRRSELIRRSLEAHTMAWAGFVPLAGIPFAAMALVSALRCRATGPDGWNPAGRYATAAKVLSVMAGFVQLGVVLLAVAYLVRRGTLDMEPE